MLGVLWRFTEEVTEIDFNAIRNGERRALAKAITLIESTKKKAAFLAAAAQAMNLENVSILPERIESVNLSNSPDLITARALARLGKLLTYGSRIAGKSTRYLFLKGQDVEGELTEAAKSWHMEVIRHPSQTSADGTVLEIRNLKRVQKR